MDISSYTLGMALDYMMIPFDGGADGLDLDFDPPPKKLPIAEKKPPPPEDFFAFLLKFIDLALNSVLAFSNPFNYSPLFYAIHMTQFT